MDPTAPVFKPTTASGTDDTTNGNAPAATDVAQEPQTNGQPKTPKQPKQQKQPAAGEAAAPVQDGEKKLSGAELKRLKKLEKQAERAAAKAAAGAPPEQPPTLARRQSAGKEQLNSPKTVDMGKHHKRTGSEAPGKSLPIRPAGTQPGAKEAAAEARKKQQFEEKKVSIFGHLYGQPRRTSMAGAGKEVHPAVLALGLQLRDYVICGSNARCVAMLLCFKRVCEERSSSGSALLTQL